MTKQRSVVRLRVLGVVSLSALTLLIVPRAIIACCDQATVTEPSGPDEVEVCKENNTYTASGSPTDGGSQTAYEWVASAGEIQSGQGTSSITWKAPENPDVTSASIGVRFGYFCTKKFPQPDWEWSEWKWKIVTITPKDCKNGEPGSNDLNILVRVDPPPVHINDAGDAETLTASGTDPDLQECGCDNPANGMDLAMTEWDAPDGHLNFTSSRGATTGVYSGDEFIGNPRARATFHDAQLPTWADDNEGSSWRKTQTVQTFRVGAQLTVDGVNSPPPFYENDVDEHVSRTKGLSAHLSHQTPSGSAGAGVVGPVGAEAAARFKVVSDPDGIVSMKSLVTVWYGGSHAASNIYMRGFDTDWDVGSSGSGSVTVTIDLWVISLSWTPAWTLSDDCVIVAAGGYGACLEGTAPDVQVPLTYTTEYDSENAAASTAPIPAFNRSSYFQGKPGAERKGEVEIGTRMEYNDVEPICWARMNVYNPYDEQLLDLADLSVTWSLTNTPRYRYSY